MQSIYVVCFVSALWLKMVYSAPVKEIDSDDAADAHVDDSKLLEKRSLDKGGFPAFGAAKGLPGHQMLDWNQMFDKKRDAAKRFGFHHEAAEEGLGNHGLKDINMLDWERVFNKRQWMNHAGDDSFGRIGALSNPDMQNWSSVLAKKRAFGIEDGNRQLGNSDGLESQNLQDWSSVFGRRRRSTQQ